MNESYIARVNCTLCGRQILNTEMRVLPSKRNPELPLGVCLICHRKHTVTGQAIPVDDRTELLETLTPTQRAVVGCMPATVEQIIGTVWPKYMVNSSKSLTHTTISQIRRKLADSGSCWQIVSSGYRPVVYDVVRDEDSD